MGWYWELIDATDDEEDCSDEFAIQQYNNIKTYHTYDMLMLSGSAI
jgi:hypothetical protein